MSRHVIANVPYVWDGIVRRCHVSSLRMVLEFYGIKYSPSYLMNVSGFNYGFHYFKEAKVAFGNPESALGPWPFMIYAAEKIGCRLDIIKDKPWDESWNLIKSYITQHIPVYIPLVNIQYLWKLPYPVPHVIVICGYDEEKGVVMIHDPALGESGEGLQYLIHTRLPEGKSGRYAEFTIEDFKNAWDLQGSSWQDLGSNIICIIHPPTERPKISWAEVVDRNAKLTKGKIEEVSGAPFGTDKTSGPNGIVQLAEDIEKAFGLLEKPSELIEIMNTLRVTTFTIGRSYKMDAHAFMAGLATVTNNQALEKASYYLRLTALHYEEGLAQMDLMLNRQSIPSEELVRGLGRISDVLSRAAESERKAGESLSEGARILSLIHA